MGRPLKPIDGDQVRKLAKLGLSQQDIGEFFGCVHSVISERFRQEYHEGVSESKISVRKLMWRPARAGADSILLRLDDRYFGPTGRKPIVDNTEVLGGAWGQTEFQVNLKLGLTPRRRKLDRARRAPLPYYYSAMSDNYRWHKALFFRNLSHFCEFRLELGLWIKVPVKQATFSQSAF